MGQFDKLRAIIASAEDSIQQEIDRGSGNPWLACFRTVVTTIRLTLEVSRPNNAPAIHGRIDGLLTRVSELQDAQNHNPVAEVKDALLVDLRMLLEGIEE